MTANHAAFGQIVGMGVCVKASGQHIAVGKVVDKKVEVVVVLKGMTLNAQLRKSRILIWKHPISTIVG